MIFHDTDTIVAPATAVGGALCVIRLSGSNAISLCDSIFKSRKPLSEARTATLHYGNIVDDEEIVDDVVVSLFRAPHSYTGEDTVEISAHGSRYVINKIISLLTSRGARLAEAGEFTRRAFLAGKLDLSQAEAVADIIASSSHSAHAIASTQMRGAYSNELQALREQLLHITSLLELELDFSEEDVEFADRRQLNDILSRIGEQIESLRGSFALGNALKSGISVAIVGEPNVGKSTLLNALIEEDRAMVSDIAGTTRDTIEASTIIDGIRFRFVDTAGLRTTDDTLEQMGIERTRRAIDKANIVVHIASAESPEFKDIELNSEQHYIKVINKIDCINSTKALPANRLQISAKQGIGINALRTKLRSTANTSSLRANDIVVSNMRHYEALTAAHTALESAMSALTRNLPADLISEDIRTIIHHLGEITGAITSDDILQSIFSKFCIGK